MRPACKRSWCNRLAAISFFVALGIASTALGQSTLYVDDSAPAGGNGQTWVTPYNNLQVALTAASNSGGVVHEVHVGAGTYRPGPQNGNRVSAIFILRNGIAIRGGYAGFGAVDPNERDFVTHESVLSGDLNSNDGPNFTNRTDNSYHVVGASSVDATAELDGFTITGGYANGGNPNDRGAAIFLYPFANSPTFRNCKVIGNRVTGKGGAMYTNESSATFYNCTFDGNVGDSGGAIYHLQSSPKYYNCWFQNNSCTGLAGAMYNYGSDTQLDNCWFRENTALAGGAMHNFQSDPVMTNCVFQQNMAVGGLSPTGGAIHNEPGSPTLINCILTANHADLRGGAIYNNHADSHPLIQNSMLVGNTSAGGGGIAVVNGVTTVINSVLAWNRDNDLVHSENTEITVFGGTLNINYTSVMDWTGALGGTGNGSFMAGFLNPLGEDQILGTPDDNLRSAIFGESVDRGDPSWLLESAGTDLDRRARVLCGRVDLGPYEAHQGDFNCDDTLDLLDFHDFPMCLNSSWDDIEVPGCEVFILTYPGHVDLRAYAWWQNALDWDGP